MPAIGNLLTVLLLVALMAVHGCWRPMPIATQGFYFPPPGEAMEMQDSRRPEEVGLDAAVIERLHGTAARWALWRHGYLVSAEGDFNKTVHVASLRKTWHALTVGAAIQQGRIPSWDQKISVWERDLSGAHAEATWWHVMTQSSGFDYPYDGYPAYRPGEMWTYSDKNPLRLTNALAKVYGKAGYHDRYEDVLRQAYFDAIGMRGWAVQPRYDGAVLSLDLEDMGRLGLLVLARGRWGNEQIVAQDFVEALETKQTRGMKVNYNGPDDGTIELDLPEAPYGFMTWVNTDRDVFPKAGSAWAWGSGAGGHAVYWNRELGIVLAVQGRKPGTNLPELVEAGVRGPNPLVQ